MCFINGDVIVTCDGAGCWCVVVVEKYIMNFVTKTLDICDFWGQFVAFCFSDSVFVTCS